MDEKPIMIPFVAFESVTSRQERTIRRLWILCIILVLLFVGSNAAWAYYENQFIDEVTITQESDSSGNGDAINGDIINGTR